MSGRDAVSPTEPANHGTPTRPRGKRSEAAQRRPVAPRGRSRYEHDESDRLPPWADPTCSDYDPSDPSGYWYRLRQEDEDVRNMYGFQW
jgi:hypothetical protein